MQVTIDRFGRVVVPKSYRQRLGLGPGRVLLIEETGAGLLLTPVLADPAIVETPDGPVIVPSDADVSSPLTDDMVRDLLEVGRP
ncbi:MAG: AbrB/MazE/SpoVT family DNA-binding domain-containing protein [Mycobacteriales bacterium]